MEKPKLQKSTFEGTVSHFMGFAALLVVAQIMLHYAGYPMENLLSALAAVVFAALGQGSAWFTSLLFDGLLWAAVCGLCVGCFAWMMVYVDSEEAGVNPPVPFFAEQRKRKYYTHKSSGIHSNYAAAVASGLTVTLLMAWTNRQLEV